MFRAWALPGSVGAWSGHGGICLVTISLTYTPSRSHCRRDRVSFANLITTISKAYTWP